MKLAILLIGILCLVASVGALQLDFQNAGDFSSYITSMPAPGFSPNGAVTWVQSSNGGNNYVVISSAGSSSSCLALTPPYTQTTYAAITKLSSTGSPGNTMAIWLFDGSMNELFRWTPNNYGIAGRYEIKMSGSTAHIYLNGVEIATSGALAQNPSNIAFCEFQASGNSFGYDDLVYGTSENKYIYDMPETGAYKIKKDMLNPAASGLYTINDVIVDSNYMSTRFGRGNLAVPPDPLTNESINLVQWGGVIPYATLYTGSDYSGARIFNIHEALINSTAPYGYYAITIPGTSLYSDPILYEAGGATVSWDKPIYSVGDTGVIVTWVADGGYWDPAVYDYQVVAQDIFGNVIQSQTVNTQSGSMSVTFDSSDNLGVYYAILKAKLKASPTYDIWMSVDTAELQAYIVFNGYVMNAESGAVLSDATVNVTQGTATKKSISGSYGWNSTNNWLSGSQFNITTNLTGYTSDVRLFTPLTSKSIALNISLIPSPATTVGTSIGGNVYDNVYGNPVVGATYWVQNGTAYSSTTNIAGFARIDNLPVPNTWYNVWSSKTGFGNSSVSQVMAVAA